MVCVNTSFEPTVNPCAPPVCARPVLTLTLDPCMRDADGSATARPVRCGGCVLAVAGGGALWLRCWFWRGWCWLLLELDVDLVARGQGPVTF